MQAPEVLGEEVTQIPGSPGTHPHPKTFSGAIPALLNTPNLAGGDLTCTQLAPSCSFQVLALSMSGQWQTQWL